MFFRRKWWNSQIEKFQYFGRYGQWYVDQPNAPQRVSNSWWHQIINFLTKHSTFSNQPHLSKISEKSNKHSNLDTKSEEIFLIPLPLHHTNHHVSHFFHNSKLRVGTWNPIYPSYFTHCTTRHFASRYLAQQTQSKIHFSRLFHNAHNRRSVEPISAKFTLLKIQSPKRITPWYSNSRANFQRQFRDNFSHKIASFSTYIDLIIRP